MGARKDEVEIKVKGKDQETDRLKQAELAEITAEGSKGKFGLVPEFNLQSEISITFSPGRGRGVFALRDFEAGERIGVCPALTLDENDADLIQYTELSNYVFSPISSEYVGKTIVAFGFASLINHTNPHNATYYAYKNAIHVFCETPIRKGEEIFIDYGWSKKEFV